MPRLPLYVVDSFADRRFTSNPAAVVPLDAWLPDAVLQGIAAEHTLGKTALVVAEAAGPRARGFTRTTEVNLGGHVTQALSSAKPGAALLRPLCRAPFRTNCAYERCGRDRAAEARRSCRRATGRL